MAGGRVKGVNQPHRRLRKKRSRARKGVAKNDSHRLAPAATPDTATDFVLGKRHEISIYVTDFRKGIWL